MDAPIGNNRIDLSDLANLPLPPEPPGFVDFWKSTYEQARSVDLQIETRRVESPQVGLEVYEIEFNSLDGIRIGGWVTVPGNGTAITRGKVHYHGYGGRSAPEFDISCPPIARIFPCARGFNRSSHPALPSVAAEHVLHGMENRESYIHRGCAADIWCAASALIQLYPDTISSLDYQGGSFGGGIGALAVPWDHRFRKAFLDIPSFGNHPLRLKTPCTGSGEAVRLLYARKPEILSVLQFFDAATAASHFSIPVFVAAALQDPSVPPCGQFSIYKAIRSSKQLFVRTTGHPCADEDSLPLQTRLDDWFLAQP